MPFTDLTSHKRRPVLVLSKKAYNLISDDIIVAAVTSVIDTKPYAVSISNDDMEEGTLRVMSCVRSDKIYTLSQALIIKRFGKVSSKILEMVKAQINGLLE